MKRSESVEWQKKYGSQLEIGSEVQIKPACKYYEQQYDKDQVYMVTYLYVDDGGLNIGINEGGTDDWSWAADGYRVDDVEPFNLNRQQDATLERQKPPVNFGRYAKHDTRLVLEIPTL